jgi:phospholipase/carboxylesterase
MDQHLSQPMTWAGASPERARAAAVVVHGRDQDPQYMLDVLARVGVEDVAYLLPRAAGHTWYPGRFIQPEEVNQPSLDDALDTLTNATEQLADVGFGPERTVLVGFPKALA